MASMKKYSIPDGKRKRDYGYYGLNSGMEHQNFLVFILRRDTCEVVGYNTRANSCFPQVSSEDGSARSFGRNQVHPEDFQELRDLLQNLDQADYTKEFYLEARLKSGNKWKSYQFQIRNYHWDFNLTGSSQEESNGNEILMTGENTSTYTSSSVKQASSSRNQPQDNALVLCMAHERLPKDSSRVKCDPELDEILFENRNKYAALIETIDEGYATIDLLYDLNGQAKDFLFLETNPAFVNHLPLNETEGHTIKELVPEYENQWLEYYQAVAATGTPKRFTNFSESLSNNWFNVFVFAVGDQEHRKLGIIFSNITESKNNESLLIGRNQTLERKIEQRTDELKENNALLQIVFDTTNEGLLVLDPVIDKNREIIDFKYLRANKVMEELQGVKDLEGSNYLEINPHAGTNGLMEIFKDVMKKGEFRDFEFWCELPDKAGAWYRITARKHESLLIVSMEDITQRKEEAETLKENIRFKKQLARTSPDIIMIFDLLQERIKYLNRDLSTLPGMRKEEVLGKKMEEIFSYVHPRERDNLLKFHQKVIAGNNDSISETEFRLRGEQKEWEWFSAVAKVFRRSLRGNVTEYIVLLRNIDAHKATQKALLNAEKLSIKGEVARTFAHELRNPLASIGMAVDIVRRQLPQEQLPVLENYLGIIRRSTKTLNKLVTDLLTASNYTPAVLKECCLAEVLEESLSLASDRIYLSGIKVVKRYKGTYPINADKEKLKIAILNIIINASEAMHPDQGILRLQIEKKNDWLILKIKDNGHGLEKQQLEKLFDAFYTQKPGGMGVGLSSVKSILEEHDAEIDVSSIPKRGTEFSLSFPCYTLMNNHRISQV